MKWQKLGVIFAPNNNYEWMLSHAANPVVEHLEGDYFRVYFSCRDRENRSNIAFVEFDINNLSKILKLADKPILSPGEIGTFDDSGVSMGCIVPVGDRRYLYYLGWNLSITVPWRNSIGLAIAESNEQNFIRYSQAPILDRNDADPYTLSYPWVMRDGDKWKMWYGSSLKWGPEQKDMEHVIKYAESDDGINWQPEGKIALPFESPDEYAMSKPCVIKEADGTYKMWHSYRGQAYRIGYAESVDGIQWTRMNKRVGIDVSASGWDWETIEYPNVFDHQGERYMLYNGNGYGKTGFGLAILVEP